MSRREALFRFFNEIGILAQLSQTQFQNLLPEGMTLAQFTILNHCIRVGDGRTPVAIARALQVTKATMTSTMQRMERKGLLSVAPAPDDGRSKQVWLTPAGRHMHAACIAAAGPWFDRFSERLQGEDLAALTSRLAAIRALLDADRD